MNEIILYMIAMEKFQKDCSGLVERDDKLLSIPINRETFN